MSSSKKTPHEPDKDAEHGIDVTGRYQRIPTTPAKEFAKTTLAAGAVVWRKNPERPDGMEVLLIHRPSYDDWSLAKGKVDPGETLPMTAVREIKEETGYDVNLGKLIGRVTYPVNGRTKVIYYWTAEYTSGTFEPNDEVDHLEWLSIEEAKERVSYQVDGEVIEKASKRFAWNPDARLILIRHAHAHAREGWGGDDDLRPLDRKGRQQAEMLGLTIGAWDVKRIYSAQPVRCQTTAQPMAQNLGLELTVDPLLGDEGWSTHMADAQRRFAEIVDQGGISVVVSQGIAIPDVVAWFSANGTLPLDDIRCKKAGMWVLTFSEGKLCGADYMASPLPVK